MDCICTINYREYISSSSSSSSFSSYAIKRLKGNTSCLKHLKSTIIIIPYIIIINSLLYG